MNKEVVKSAEQIGDVEDESKVAEVESSASSLESKSEEAVVEPSSISEDTKQTGEREPPTELPGRNASPPENNFKISLSSSVQKKLSQKAADEGVTPSELAAELIAEGLVLRAFEIAERKQAMRGGSSSGGNTGSNSGRSNQRSRNQNSGSRRGGQNRRGGGGGGGGNYKNIMEDSASFLEYVRNQEKKRR